MAEHTGTTSEKIYLAIAGSLAGLTIISYLADLVGLRGSALVLVVLVVAVIKATLVAAFFMHLKIDWTKVKVMIIPALLLAAVLVFALLPDITLAKRDAPGTKPPVASPNPSHGAVPSR